MAEQIKARLLKPLDGRPEGSPIELDKHDFDTLEALHAVERIKAEPAPQNKMARAPANKAGV